jgi:hypothetical protein
MMPWAEQSDTKRPSRSGIDNADPALPVFGHIADGTAETEVRYRKRRCMPRVEPRLSYTLRPEGHAPLLMYKFCPGRQQSGSQQRLFFRAHSHKSQNAFVQGSEVVWKLLKTEAPRDGAPTPKHLEVGNLVRRSFRVSLSIVLESHDSSITFTQLLRNHCENCRNFTSL